MKIDQRYLKKNLKTVIIKTQNQMGMLNIRLNNDEERIDKQKIGLNYSRWILKSKDKI